MDNFNRTWFHFKVRQGKTENVFEIITSFLNTKTLLFRFLCLFRKLFLNLESVFCFIFGRGRNYQAIYFWHLCPNSVTYQRKHRERREIIVHCGVCWIIWVRKCDRAHTAPTLRLRPKCPDRLESVGGGSLLVMS